MASGLSAPTAFVFTPDGRILIAEKAGTLRVVKAGSLLGTPAVTLATTSNSERGLLGIALDPAFSTNGLVYLYYTTSSGSFQPPGHPFVSPRNRVSRLAMSADTIVTSSETVILDDIPSDAGNHNAGWVQFGPDGRLYVATGDGGATPSNAQTLANLAGKILRINSDGTIPNDNPFATTPGARGEIWCYGLRNPWRFTFDAAGRLFIGDVGSNLFEEVDVGGARLNFGWPIHEGIAGDLAYVDPIYAYPHGGGTAITVGAFNSGSAYPAAYNGVMFFGDWVQGFIRTLQYNPATGTATVTPFATGAGGPVHFASGPDGSMYYLAYFVGELRRLDFALHLDVTVAGAGSVSSSPAGITCGSGCSATYAAGTVVTLTPAPSAGYAFAGWSGDSDCFNGQVAVTRAVACTATFQPVGAPATSRMVDLSGDGAGDVFLYDATSGAWSMAMSTRAGSFSFMSGSWSPQWTVIPAQLNADALIDVFLYNVETGQWFQALNNGAGGFAYTTGFFSPGWQVLAGRLNQDAVDDLFVYNPVSGSAFQCWVNASGGFSAFYREDWSPGWQVYRAELNGDGLTDLFLYNLTTGQWFRCLNTGNGRFTYSTDFWSPGWQVTTGDFNGDRLDDVFVYNAGTGVWASCLNTGAGFSYHAGVWSPGWQVFRARLGGDGSDDLFLYNPINGQWFQCYSDGRGGFSRYVSSLWSPDWMIAVTDLDGDGVEDVFVYNATTGRYFQCITAAAGDFRSYATGTAAPGLTIIGQR